MLGDDVQAAMRFARGGGGAAIVALALAVVTGGGESLPIDRALYASLDQAMVVCGTGDAAAWAKQFAAIISSRDGREGMPHDGFALTDERPPTRTP